MSSERDYGRSWSIARRFLPELRQHAGRMGLVSALSLVVAGFDLLRPWPIQWIFDGALMHQGEPAYSFGTIVWAGVIAAAVIALIRASSGYLRELELARVAHQYTRNLRYRIFAHLSRLSPSFHAHHKSGDLLVRLMGDVPMVSTMMVDSSVELLTRGLIVVGTVVVMALLDPLLTLAIFGALPIVFLVVRWISGRIRIAVRKQRRKEGDLADYLHEAIAASETIQALGGSNHVVRRFARNNRRSARAGLKAKRLAARMGASVESLLGLSLAGVLCMGSFRVAAGELTPGELLVFLSYVRSLLKPIRAASKHAERIAKGTACGERILTILDEQPLIVSLAGAPPAPVSPERLTFRDVTFAYGKAEPALSHFSAEFRRGELAALVGRSGAGKSTAAALTSRLFDPDSGQVLLDDQPLSSFDLESMRDRVGLCLQRTVLFGESLRENLLLGKPDATSEQIQTALAEAGAAEFVRTLPEGVDTRLGAQGAGLSGGQLARISLARTLLRTSPILIVDEPFAGLDREAAHKVADTLRRLAVRRIVIVIAHDLERLDEYARIVFIEEGRKVAEGSHANLLAAEPLYGRIVRTTAGANA